MVSFDEHGYTNPYDNVRNTSYRQATLDSAPVIVLDPNTFSSDGTVAVTNCAVSHDGTLLAYALSQHGSDWQTIKIRQVDTGQDYAESSNSRRSLNSGIQRDIPFTFA